MAYSRTGFTVQTNGQTLVVTATLNGSTSTLYSDPEVTSSVTLPHTITSDTTYYVADAGFGTQIPSVKQPDGTELWGRGLDCYRWTGIQVIAPLPSAAQVGADVVRRDLSLAPTGAVAETLPRFYGYILNNAVLSTGRLHLTMVYLPAGAVASNITYVSGTTAASVPTAQWFALYNSARGLLAQTADDGSTAWAGDTAKTLAIASPFTTTYSGLYYVGINVTATTVPTLIGGNVSTNITGIAPKANGTSTTGLTTTAPATAAAITAANIVPYAYIS